MDVYLGIWQRATLKSTDLHKKMLSIDFAYIAARNCIEYLSVGVEIQSNEIKNKKVGQVYSCLDK